MTIPLPFPSFEGCSESPERRLQIERKHKLKDGSLSSFHNRILLPLVTHDSFTETVFDQEREGQVLRFSPITTVGLVQPFQWKAPDLELPHTDTRTDDHCL